ncbi:MAG: hypothetical protein JSU96_21335 [Acidobacteriota bacterium]|nr:MAG: hypothetical protein JSU96_21335 [Acidobacteriota bacterium]
MAVYKHSYRRYEGDLTARWQRLLVLPRYAYRGVFQSRFFLIFFVICLIVPLGAALLIYLRHNIGALDLMNIPDDAILPINATFFEWVIQIQGSFAFLLTVFVGPGLVSPDLVNNALPLYLSRPFSRTEYVVGKMSVLMILQSCVTWVPLCVLFLLQASLAEGNWISANTRILVAILLGSAVWILLLSLLAMAISAWVRWKAIAGALMFGVFLVGAGFGETVSALFNTKWGSLFNISSMMQVIWEWLFFGGASETGETVNRLAAGQVPVWSACLALVVIGLCCLFLLSRRIRAYEVVR